MSTAATPFNPVPTLTFRLKSSSFSSKFSPRLGQLCLTRPTAQGTLDGTEISIELPTPGLMCSTTRGVIKHLSRDNVKRTPCVKWVHVPFESFLQTDPPVPTQQEGSHPLHTFLGFSPSQHVLSLSLRDPADGREMPPNGKAFVAAQSSRGSRKVACPAYRSYATAVLPDIVFSLSDVPFSSPPHSQKRISKSIERSAQWLTTIIAPLNLIPKTSFQDLAKNIIASQPTLGVRLNVFLHMIGGIKPAARAAFAAALQEPLEPKEKELIRLKTLDEGVSGYSFDLVPLRTELLVERLTPSALPSAKVQYSLMESFSSLIKASLEDLPTSKPRLVNTTQSPHEMLALIRDAGVDLFDTFLAQQAATWGVALDFRFPVPSEQDQQKGDSSRLERTKKQDIGHNLYEERYAHDFGRLADWFLDGLAYSKQHSDSSTPSSTGGSPGERAFCSCATCSPTWVNDPIIHSTVDEPGAALGTRELAPPYTRAYLHHLLHTHEMSAHALLAMHNLTVMDAFMNGVRAILQQERGLEISGHPQSQSNEGVIEGGGTHGPLSGENGMSDSMHSLFAAEVARFEQTYDASLGVLAEAKSCWEEVDHARGKGRLARERAKGIAEGIDVPAVSTTANLDGVLR